MTDARNTISLSNMSNNVVDIMKWIAEDEGIRTLLSVHDKRPFKSDFKHKVLSLEEIMSTEEGRGKILAHSFNVEAKKKDDVQIRVYYNIGRFDGSGAIMDANLHIDIFCAKSLWMIEDEVKHKTLIRPYEIMSRILDNVGRKNIRNIPIGLPQQFQLLSVNEYFDAIRIFYSSFDVIGNPSGMRG